MKFTIITVCLNSAETLERTIKSVIGQKQDAMELEYIVIDGGSTDGTAALLKQYDLYIDKWVSEPDHGIFDAMNKGIGMAGGDIIAFLNSDDWYEKNALKIVADVFDGNDCDCVCGDNYVLEKNGQKVYFDTSGKSVEDLYVQMIYYHSAIFCKKEFFKRDGNFDCQYRMAADYEWFLGIVEKGARLRYIHKPVFTFSYGGISSTNAIECAREARKIALRHLTPDKGEGLKTKIDRRFYEAVLYAVDKEAAYPKLIEILGENRTNILWGAGARGVQWVRWFQDAGIEIGGVVDKNSFHWGSFIEEIPVYSPKILEDKVCNVIITPEKFVNEIKKEISKMKNGCIYIFELDILCKRIAESVLQ